MCMLMLGVGVQLTKAATLSQTVLNVMDTNANPNIFEANLSVDEQDVDINGTTVHAIIYKDLNNAAAYAGTPDGIPIRKSL